MERNSIFFDGIYCYVRDSHYPLVDYRAVYDDFEMLKNCHDCESHSKISHSLLVIASIGLDKEDLKDRMAGGFDPEKIFLHTPESRIKRTNQDFTVRGIPVSFKSGGVACKPLTLLIPHLQ